MDPRTIVTTGERRPDLDIHDAHKHSASALAYEVPGHGVVFRAGEMPKSRYPAYIASEMIEKSKAEQKNSTTP